MLCFALLTLAVTMHCFTRLVRHHLGIQSTHHTVSLSLANLGNIAVTTDV